MNTASSNTKHVVKVQRLNAIDTLLKSGNESLAAVNDKANM